MSSQFVCAGFHRSGTSLGSQILHLAGLPYAIEEMAGNQSNPDGHFEDLVAMRMHDDFLAESGTSWKYNNEVNIQHNDSIIERIEQYSNCRDEFSGALWLMKDPRATLFLDDWNTVLKNGKFILMYRHWGLCVQSLLKRHSQLIAHGLPKGNALLEHTVFWTDPELAARMWISYNEKMISFIEHNQGKCLVVSQASLMQGYDLIEGVNRRFGDSLVSSEISPVKAEYASETIDPAILEGVSPELVQKLNEIYQKLEVLSDSGKQKKAPEFKEKVNISTESAYLLNVVSSAKKQVKGATTVITGLDVLDCMQDQYNDLPFENILSKLESLHPLKNEASALAGLSFANRLVSIDPYDTTANEWMGRLCFRLKSYQKAEEYFVKAIAIGKSFPYMKMLLADVYAASYDFKRAEYYYLLAFKGNPKNPMFSIRLADTYSIKNEYVKAKESYSNALLLSDSDWVRGKLIEAIAKVDGIDEAIKYAQEYYDEKKTTVGRQKLITLKLKNRSLDAKNLYKLSVKESITKEAIDELITELSQIDASPLELERMLVWVSSHYSSLFSVQELDELFCPLENNMDSPLKDNSPLLPQSNTGIE